MGDPDRVGGRSGEEWGDPGQGTGDPVLVSMSDKNY